MLALCCTPHYFYNKLFICIIKNGGAFSAHKMVVKLYFKRKKRDEKIQGSGLFGALSEDNIITIPLLFPGENTVHIQVAVVVSLN